MKRLAIADAARTDLADIARYTEERWGAVRRRRYMEEIRRRYTGLRRRPPQGRPREDMCRSCRALIVGQHVLIYRETDDQIELLRVLHQRMDMRAYMVDD